jgi:hypothetical protein
MRTVCRRIKLFPMKAVPFPTTRRKGRLARIGLSKQLPERGRQPALRAGGPPPCVEFTVVGGRRRGH